jgi:hypothetical protein
MSRLAEGLVLYRFAITCLLAAVGGLAIFFGYRLFTRHAGTLRGLEKLSLKSGETTVSLAGVSTGGVLMLTSVAWGYWSYASIPKLRVADSGAIDVTERARPAGAGQPTRVVRAQEPGQFMVSDVRGANVYDADGAKVGDVSDVLFNSKGDIVAYVVGLGGFLGIGSKDVALPPNAFEITTPAQAREPKLKLFVNKDQLKQAAEFRPLPRQPSTMAVDRGPAGLDIRVAPSGDSSGTSATTTPGADTGRTGTRF